MSNSIITVSVDGKTFWVNKDTLDSFNKFQEQREKGWFDYVFYGIVPKEMKFECESFYFVILSNGEKQTLGMKSRLSGRIYLTDKYEVDINQPIEETDYKYVRDARGMDI